MVSAISYGVERVKECKSCYHDTYLSVNGILCGNVGFKFRIFYKKKIVIKFLCVLVLTSIVSDVIVNIDVASILCGQHVRVPHGAVLGVMQHVIQRIGLHIFKFCNHL